MIPQVKIRDRRNVEIVALLGQGTAKPDGYGGWEVVPRPKRKPFVEWTSGELITMPIPMMFDAWMSGAGVQLEVDALEEMASGDEDGEPQVVTLIGPIPHTDLDWVITGIEWGELLRSDTGRLMRAPFTLTVTEDERADLVISRAARKRAKKGKKQRARFKQTSAAPGDTLMDIAAREYGDPNRWREIAEANGLRDPKKVPLNTLLRIP